jgi:hypothetical protein
MIGIRDLEAIIRDGPSGLRDRSLEHALVAVRHRVATTVRQNRRDGSGERPESPDRHAVRAIVGAEHGMRVVVQPGDYPFQFAWGNLRRLRGGIRDVC